RPSASDVPDLGSRPSAKMRTPASTIRTGSCRRSSSNTAQPMELVPISKANDVLFTSAVISARPPKRCSTTNNKSCMAEGYCQVALLQCCSDEARLGYCLEHFTLVVQPLATPSPVFP